MQQYRRLVTLGNLLETIAEVITEVYQVYYTSWTDWGVLGTFLNRSDAEDYVNEIRPVAEEHLDEYDMSDHAIYIRVIPLDLPRAMLPGAWDVEVCPNTGDIIEKCYRFWADPSRGAQIQSTDTSVHSFRAWGRTVTEAQMLANLLRLSPFGQRWRLLIDNGMVLPVDR